MTESEFRNEVIPFLRYLQRKFGYYNPIYVTDDPIVIGNLVLFCSIGMIPNAIAVLDEAGEIVDSFVIGGTHYYNGVKLVANDNLGEISEEVVPST